MLATRDLAILRRATDVLSALAPGAVFPLDARGSIPGRHTDQLIKFKSVTPEAIGWRDDDRAAPYATLWLDESASTDSAYMSSALVDAKTSLTINAFASYGKSQVLGNRDAVLSIHSTLSTIEQSIRVAMQSLPFWTGVDIQNTATLTSQMGAMSVTCVSAKVIISKDAGFGVVDTSYSISHFIRER